MQTEIVFLLWFPVVSLFCLVFLCFLCSCLSLAPCVPCLLFIFSLPLYLSLSSCFVHFLFYFVLLPFPHVCHFTSCPCVFPCCLIILLCPHHLSTLPPPCFVCRLTSPHMKPDSFRERPSLSLSHKKY